MDCTSFKVQVRVDETSIIKIIALQSLNKKSGLNYVALLRRFRCCKLGPTIYTAITSLMSSIIFNSSAYLKSRNWDRYEGQNQAVVPVYMPERRNNCRNWGVSPPKL